MITFYTDYVDHAYAVMVKIPDYPPREAWYKWFTDKASAQKVATLMNCGVIQYIHPCRKEYGQGCEFCQALANEEKQKFINQNKELQNA